VTVPEIVKAGSMPVGVRAATLGGLLVSGALHALMPDLWGWVLVLVALLAGLLGALTAVTFCAPCYIIVVASALVGAALTIVGAMTMVDEVECQGASWRGLSSFPGRWSCADRPFRGMCRCSTRRVSRHVVNMDLLRNPVRVPLSSASTML
jgi:hypothetical protein